MESVIESGAEVLCAGDRSCLMHIGGGLERIRAGIKTLHRAEILASTDGDTDQPEQRRADLERGPAVPAERKAGRQRLPTAPQRPQRDGHDPGTPRGPGGGDPDWQELRHAGAAIKDDVLHHLDHYLTEFERNATARGAHVHWARDATEANVVTDLISKTGHTEVIKVKSMATQEIGLVDALAGQGIAAHETDLAELITQLSHDRPSHIVVPALHRNRAEIRRIFLDHMPDAPEDLPTTPTRSPKRPASTSDVCS
jgi:hypothetical protein